MLSVKGIYENGEVRLLEEIPNTKRAKVIVTILDKEEGDQEEPDLELFDDLVGAISVREDGAVNHDQYLISERRT